MSFTSLFTPDRQSPRNRDHFVTLTQHGDVTDNDILRTRARARVGDAVGEAVRNRLGSADDATVNAATDIVLRGLGRETLERIVAGGDGTHAIQALIPQATQPGTPPPFNWSAITPAELDRLRALGLLSEQQHRMALAQRGDDASTGDGTAGSSLRFDDTFLRSPAGREMQAYAREHGLEWAANRADVLRLGREAIQLFARTNFRQESFDRLRDVGFNGQQITRLARFAERTGQDANEVARIGADSIRIFGGQNEAERRRWVQMLDTFHDNPNNVTAHQDLDRALHRMETTGTAEQQEQARRQREIVERARQTEADAAARTEREAAETARREAERVASEAETAKRAGNTGTLTNLLEEPAPPPATVERPAGGTPPPVAAPPPPPPQHVMGPR